MAATTQQKRVMTLNIGPQHPSTHGVLRLKVLLDGETVMDVEPIIGYLHRGSEKLGESGTYLQFIPYTDRMDYLAAIHNNMAFCKAAEDLGKIDVPERARVLRVLSMEINRIASHLLWLGTFGLDVGALTPFFWCWREREGALGLLERLTGTRLTYSYVRFGGVHGDADDRFMKMAWKWVEGLPKAFTELDRLLTENDIFVARLKDVGVLDKNTAIAWAISGPMLRASGVPFDIRKAEPYTGYETYDWEIAVADGGDCYARYEVRMEEMWQSLAIVRQALERLPETKGPVINPAVGEGAKQLRFHPPAGEIYSRIESPRGELGVFLVSDDTTRPYRVKVRAPSFSNVAVLPEISRGQKIADLVVTLGSIDITLGDIDR